MDIYISIYKNYKFYEVYAIIDNMISLYENIQDILTFDIIQLYSSYKIIEL